MASDKIKGLTVKIGADTSDFVKELKKVDKEINATQKTANELEKGLRFEFDSSRFTQAQKNVQQALETTEEKAKAIRQQLKFLEETGSVNTEGYNRLQTELAKTETNAIRLRQQLEGLDKIKFENASKSINNLSNGLQNAANKTAVLSAAAAGAIAGIVKLGKDAVETGDEIQTTADKYNLSAEAIQRWNYIALQSDVASEQLYKGMTKARDAIGTILVGETNTATDALEKLFGNLGNIPSDAEKGFGEIIEKLSQVEDSTLQAYYANEIFGERIATDLIPLIKNGGDTLDKLNKEFEAIGYLSNDAVRSLADFDNELNIMTQRLELVKNELGIAFKPTLEIIVDFIENSVVPALQKLSQWFMNLTSDQQEMILKALLLAAALSPVLKILSSMLGVIPALMSSLNGINGILGAISSHPIIAIIGLIATLLLVLYTRNEEFRESLNELLDLLNRSAMPVLNLVSQLLEDILGLVTPLLDIIGEDLAQHLQLLATILEPFVVILEYIFGLVEKINDGIMTLFGKGSLWGKNDKETKKKTSTATSSTNFDYSSILNEYGVTLPDNSSTNNYTDNSNINVNVSLNASGDLNYDAKSLADEVIKRLAIKKQSTGR